MPRRNYANFDIAGNYEVKKAAPLDNRMRTPFRDELISNDWVTYKGMICEVTDDGDYNGLYELTDTDSRTMSNWRKVTSYRPSKETLDYNDYNIVQSVGGFSSDSGWKPLFLEDYTYDQLFDILLFPIKLSIKENPIVNINITPSGDIYDPQQTLFQVNSNVTFNMDISSSGNKVQLNGQEIANPYSGDISSAYYTNFNGQTVDLSFNGYSIVSTDFSHTILNGDQSLNVYITYHDGSFRPYNTNGIFDTSSTDYTNNNNKYRGASGEYVSQTHKSTVFITGICPIYINDQDGLFTQLPNDYNFTETVYFTVSRGVIPTSPFKFAIDRVRFDYLSDNSYTIIFEEDVNYDNDFQRRSCKFYNSTNDLCHNHIVINLDTVGNISYVAFETQYENPFGNLVVPTNFRFLVEQNE
tara:strand:- start:89 stop:1324 length:1236 start_codon:yes stop_codon:yes gene_type:complete